MGKKENNNTAQKMWDFNFGYLEENYEIIVENIGEQDSSLDWTINSFPEWSNWTFTPIGGINLKPGYPATILISHVVTDEINSEYADIIIISNIENISNYEIIDVSLTTPKKTD